MTLRADSDETTPPDLSLPVTLTGVNEPNKNTILVKRTAEGNVNCNLDSHYKLICMNSSKTVLIVFSMYCSILESRKQCLIVLLA